MTGEMMWEAYCRTTNTNCNTRHDIWKFCGGGAAADELANLVLAGIKTATASTKLAYELEGENLPEVGTYSVILFDNEEAACIIEYELQYTARYMEVLRRRVSSVIQKYLLFRSIKSAQTTLSKRAKITAA